MCSAESKVRGRDVYAIQGEQASESLEAVKMYIQLLILQRLDYNSIISTTHRTKSLLTRPCNSLQCPLLEPLQNYRGSLRFLARECVLGVAVGKGAGPVVIQVCVVVMHNHIIPAMSRDSLTSTAQMASLVRANLEPVSLRPVVNVSYDISRVCIFPSVDPASIFDGSVFEAMEFHDWYRRAAWIAWHRFLVAIEIESSGYGREGSDTFRCFWVAR